MESIAQTPTALQQRVCGNKAYAAQIRRDLTARHPSPTVAIILSNMTDEELILQKLNKEEGDRAVLYASITAKKVAK